MNTSSIMLILGLSYFLAHGFNFVFLRYRIPDVLLFMLIGIVLGPLTGFAGQDTFGRAGETFSTLALVLILYDSGVSLDLRAMASAWSQTLGLTLITSFVTAVVFYFVGRALGLSSDSGLILGAVLSGTSSAVVIPMAKALKLEGQAVTIATIESALTDVLCIVLASSFIQAQLQGVISVGTIVQGVGLSLLGAVILGFVLGFIWNIIGNYMKNIPNSNFATLAFGLLVYGAAEAISVSGGIAIMSYGFTLANSQWMFKRESGLSPIENRFYSELIFVLKTFFFVYMGISIIFERVSILALALVGTLLCFLLRMVICRFALSSKMPLRDRSYLSLLIPKGLAAAVLAGMPLQYGLEGGETIRLTVYSVVFISILVSALVIPIVERPNVFALFGKILGPSRPS